MIYNEELIKICFHEFCSIAGDSPCGCDGCPYGNYDTENGECYEEYKKHKLKKLEQAGVTVQKWIPVTERLPKDWEDVLVRLQCGDCVVAARSGPIWRVRWFNGRLDREPTHWMPLPEPPEEVL